MRPLTIFSFPQAEMMEQKTWAFSLLFTHRAFNSLQSSSSSVGSLMSDLRLPSARIRETKSSSSFTSAASYSTLLTMGCCMLAEVGAESSYFLLVKMSVPTMVALAEPCFPGLAVEQSMTLQGFPFNMAYPPFLIDPAWIGTVSVEPASPVSKSSWSDIKLVEILININGNDLKIFYNVTLPSKLIPQKLFFSKTFLFPNHSPIISPNSFPNLFITSLLSIIFFRSRISINFLHSVQASHTTPANSNSRIPRIGMSF